jgi:N-acylneuraminate cytidylyltransferase
MPDETVSIAIIPARGGSKGIPRKNLAPVLGVPLIAYSIRAARESQRFAAVLVSTEDAEIARVAHGEGALVVERPPDLARDDSPTEPCILHALDWWKESQGSDPDWVALLQPTSPLRDSKDIQQAFTILATTGADSVLTVVEKKEFHWRAEGSVGVPLWDIRNRPRRQELQPDFVENGAIYITRSWVYRQSANRLGEKIALSVMPAERSIDVDEPFDLRLVEMILRQRKELP